MEHKIVTKEDLAQEKENKLKELESLIDTCRYNRDHFNKKLQKTSELEDKILKWISERFLLLFIFTFGLIVPFMTLGLFIIFFILKVEDISYLKTYDKELQELESELYSIKYTES